MKRSGRVFLILLFLFLHGCAETVPLQRGQLAPIERGTPPAQLEQILGKATPVTQFEANIGGQDYFVRSYNLQTGTRMETQMICSPYCFAIPVAVPVMTPYAVIQALPSRDLFAWGTLEELSKDPNPAVSSIMPTVKEQIATRSKK